MKILKNQKILPNERETNFIQHQAYKFKYCKRETKKSGEIGEKEAEMC